MQQPQDCGAPPSTMHLKGCYPPHMHGTLVELCTSKHPFLCGCAIRHLPPPSPSAPYHLASWSIINLRAVQAICCVCFHVDKLSVMLAGRTLMPDLQKGVIISDAQWQEPLPCRCLEAMVAFECSSPHGTALGIPSMDVCQMVEGGLSQRLPWLCCRH